MNDSYYASKERIRKNEVYPTSVHNNTSFNAKSINFTIYTATGGQVVEFMRFDPDSGTNYSKLYIIHDCDNIGEELSMILTKEGIS